MRFDGAIIFVKDLTKALEFYAVMLGLAPVSGGVAEGWVTLSGGTASLLLHAIPPQIAGSIEIASPPVPREETPIKLAFAVDDIDAERTRLESMGVQVIRRAWGACDVVDPEGNILQIRPAARAAG